MSSPKPAKSRQPDFKGLRGFLLRLRAQREARAWTQAELAERMGVSRATYENLERGQANLSLRSLLRLLEVFDCEHRFSDLLPSATPGVAGPGKLRPEQLGRSKPVSTPSPANRPLVELKCQID